MDVTEIFGYIQIIPMGVALCIGFIIKNAVPSDAVNRYIPIISAVIGVLVSWWVGGAMTPEILLGGLISGLAATGLYEAFRQVIDKASGTTN